MRGKWVKNVKKLLACSLCLTVVGTVSASTACSTNNGNSSSGASNEITQTVKESLRLNAYSVTLFVGETYQLQPQKYGTDGKESEIQKISYTVESDYVATCVGGTITAKTVGETYIEVEADGLTVSFFLTVKNGIAGTQYAIRLAENEIYQGIPATAYVYATTNGGAPEVVQNVTWSGADILNVSQNGTIVATATAEGAELKATFTVDGETHELETTVRVETPFDYVLENNCITVASTKTYTGENNDKHLTNSVRVVEKNLLTGEGRFLGTDEISVSELDKSVAFTAQVKDDKVVVTATGAAAEDVAYVKVNKVDRRLRLGVTVGTAIKTVADMDKLSIASLIATEDLAKSYVLVGDIDYAGDAVYPIASWRETTNNSDGYRAGNTNRRPSIVWKYLLDKTESGYSIVARDKIGKWNQGLTDTEFLEFAQNGAGINPKTTPFTGTFDGNGYAIKNAKLLCGTISSEANLYPAAVSLFGLTVGAKICNLSVQIAMQTPIAYATEKGVAMNRFYQSNKLVDADFALKDDKFMYHGGSMIGRAHDTTIENVALEFTCSTEMTTVRDCGALVGWGSQLVVRNNVVQVVGNTVNDSAGSRMRGLIGEVGSFAVGKIENNLVIGAKTLHRTVLLDEKAECGQNGNWWRSATDWSVLWDSSIGASAKSPMALSDVISTFDTSVWDVSQANATGKGIPTLIKGCSFPTV